jgi:hypothetical protein
MISDTDAVDEIILQEDLVWRDKALVTIGRRVDIARAEVARLERVLELCVEPECMSEFRYSQERMACTVRFLDEDYKVIWEETVKEER